MAKKAVRSKKSKKTYIPWGKEKAYGKLFAKEFKYEDCPDCGVAWEKRHKSKCDIEECIKCGEQLHNRAHKNKSK